MTSSNPPAYPDSEFDSLVATLENLRLSASTTTGTGPLYRFGSPSASGYTSHWDEAAEHSQGVPHGHVSRVSPRPKRRTGGSKGYAVFFGVKPGAYKTWDETWPLVDGVPGNLYQSYPNFDMAGEAFVYACERGWTRICLSPGAPSRPMVSTPAPIPWLPQPIGLLDAANPLHTGTTGSASRGHRWYVVYHGITPGVYQSSLECGLNTVGVSGARHDSWDCKEVAIAKYQHALAEGRVKVVSPRY
ncbi:hypothetical protein DFH06DRAFT_1337076 [Mycena polygramma]|nr:hypothetical protein DFH06DRAFT_1337076 [Mycena polygramma]